MVWYFEPIGPFLARLIEIFQKVGLIRAKLKKIDHNMECVRDDGGENEYHKILEDAREICRRIKKERLARDTLIKSMDSVWSTNKVLQYFDHRVFEKELRRECVRIRLVKWIVTNDFSNFSSDSALLIAKKKWFFYLKAYAVSKDIRLLGYKVTKLVKIKEAVNRILGASRLLLPALKNAAQPAKARIRTGGQGKISQRKAVAKGRPASTAIAVRYHFRKLSFNPTERSEFFWLIGSGIPYSKVILYDYVEQNELDDDLSRLIKESGIRVIKNRGAWYRDGVFTARMFSVMSSMILKLTFNTLIILAKGRWVSPYTFGALTALALDYAYWHDFFFRNRVRVNVVSAVKPSAAQVLALDALNGVSFSYQYSISNFLSPALARVVAEDVLFVFSDIFEKRWRKIDAPVEIFVKTGFIDDGPIQKIRCLQSVREDRGKLRASGAQFVLCFFDENSGEQWYMPFTNENAAKDYEYLIKWLLQDTTLGLVLKPKKAGTLFQRMPHLSTLISQAVDTGRCLLLKSEGIIGNIYPSQTAMMSDLCIGKTYGGTAALEASLAGVRSVLMDDLVWSSHPFYEWGHGRVIFEDWDSLRTSVEQYRSSPETCPGFGDWSPGLNDLDRFQDGQTSLRMGLYIRWVYEALKEGKSKQDALWMATERFAQRWGPEHITPG